MCNQCDRPSLQSQGTETPPEMPPLCWEHAGPWISAWLKQSMPVESINQACQTCGGRPAEEGLAVCLDCRVMAEKAALVVA